MRIRIQPFRSSSLQNSFRRTVSYRDLKKPVFLADGQGINIDGKTAFNCFVKVRKKLFKSVTLGCSPEWREPQPRTRLPPLREQLPLIS